jgi:hypothetical protein
MQSLPIGTNLGRSNPTQTSCTRYNNMWSSLSMTCNRSVVFWGYFGFLYQQIWLPWYNGNIVERSLHWQTSWLVANRSLFLILNAVLFSEKIKNYQCYRYQLTRLRSNSQASQQLHHLGSLQISINIYHILNYRKIYWWFLIHFVSKDL